MSADVEKRTHGPLGVSPDDDRILSHVGRAEIAGARDLAVVAQIHPASGEEHSAFALIDLRIDMDRATDKAPVVIDKSVDIDVHP